MGAQLPAAGSTGGVFGVIRGDMGSTGATIS